jgi:hypothetical protein
MTDPCGMFSVELLKKSFGFFSPECYKQTRRKNITHTLFFGLIFSLSDRKRAESFKLFSHKFDIY